MLPTIQYHEPAAATEFSGLSTEAVRAIRKGCAAWPPTGTTAQARRIEELIEAGAWTEAALALVALQLPDWTVRRIEIDDGEWFCSLQRHAAMPLEFDECVEGRHRLLALAILAALAEARRQTLSGGSHGPTRSAQSAPSSTTAWFDNCR